MPTSVHFTTTMYMYTLNKLNQLPKVMYIMICDDMLFYDILMLTVRLNQLPKVQYVVLLIFSGLYVNS